jgi:signal transduction histidine kinase
VVPEDHLFTPLTVLIVAPLAEETGPVCDALAQAGYSLIHREDCAAAEKDVEKETLGLLLVDGALLRGRDGWEAGRRLMARARGRRIPSLVLLSPEEDAEQGEGLLALADDLLFRPVRRLELLRRVRMALRVRLLQAEVERASRMAESQSLALCQLDRMKAGFMAIVSHELRTPLTPIVAYVEMLLDGQLGPLLPQQEEALGVVQAKAVHLQRLIEDLLSYVTMERGEATLAPKAISLDELLQAAANAFAARCQRNQISLMRAWPCDLPKVRGDPQQLRRVLEHLLDNACKFTPPGGRVTVRAYCEGGGAAANGARGDAHPRVYVAVEDTGIGISPEQQERIFEPFYQVDSSLTRRYSGLGLGLALARRILWEHGSELHVVSEEGKGSVFTFSLAACEPTLAERVWARGRVRVR